MLDWLKTILGEAYSEKIDKKVSDEIGKAFVDISPKRTIIKSTRLRAFFLAEKERLELSRRGLADLRP